MGRIGKRILAIPDKVEVKVDDGKITVKGPKGTLTQDFRPEIEIKVEGKNVLTVCRAEGNGPAALQGTYNALVKNMLTGVTAGFTKELELMGVGYRASLQGKKLAVQVGFSHPVEFDPQEGIEFTVTGNTKVVIKGADRQQVGAVAAEIRRIRAVGPYKGKGIKYAGEVVRRKAGKAAKATVGG